MQDNEMAERTQRRRRIWRTIATIMAVLVFGMAAFICSEIMRARPDSTTAEPIAVHPDPTPTAADALPVLNEAVPEVPVAVDMLPIDSPTVSDEPAPAHTEKLLLSGLKIGIDPGHQAKGNRGQEPVSPGSAQTKDKVSSGTTGVATKIPEYKTNLAISLMLRERLRELGAEIKMTRETDDVDISNVERAQMMNEWGADLVLRIHCNAAESSSKTGIGLYVRKTGDKAEESHAAAEALIERMVVETGAKKDGVFKSDTYSGLNWSTVPSILVENGFMTNREEDEKLNNPHYQRKLVEGMAQGVADYFGFGE